MVVAHRLRNSSLAKSCIPGHFAHFYGRDENEPFLDELVLAGLVEATGVNMHVELFASLLSTHPALHTNTGLRSAGHQTPR